MAHDPWDHHGRQGRVNPFDAADQSVEPLGKKAGFRSGHFDCSGHLLLSTGCIRSLFPWACSHPWSGEDGTMNSSVKSGKRAPSFVVTRWRAEAAPLKPRAISARAGRDTHKKENHPANGQNCENRRPQEGNGHDEVDRLSQVQQAHAHRQAREGPRARGPRRNLYLVLRVRLLREALSGNENSG